MFAELRGNAYLRSSSPYTIPQEEGTVTQNPSTVPLLHLPHFRL